MFWGDGKNIYQAKKVDMPYDRMKALEKYTNYEFSNTQKVEALKNDLVKESSKTFNSIDSFFSSVGSGFLNSAKFFKYLPFLVIKMR